MSVARWALVAFGLLTLLAFGFAGPLASAICVVAALPLVVAIGSRLAWPRSLFLALLAPFLFIPQAAPAIWVFDPIGMALIAAGIVSLVMFGARSDWDLKGAQWLALASLAVPLLALPTTVISPASFLGGYKTFVLEAGLVLALPRLARRDRPDLLLWAFPISGLVVSAQIAVKLGNLGAIQLARLEMRNFYSKLGWGESNYIAAVLILCALGTAVLAHLQRSHMRLVLFGAAALMVLASVRLYSRGASVALAIALVVYFLGLGGKRSVGLLVGAGVGGALLAASPYGRTLLARFTDPVEYASWAVRVQIWQGMWGRFLAHPWSGIGVNQTRYQPDGMGDVQAHNLLVQYLSDQGVFGGILCIAIIVAFFRLVGSLEVPPGIGRREVRLSALAMLIACLVNAMIEPTLVGYTYGILFIYFVAWMRMAARRPTRVDDSAVGRAAASIAA